MLLRHRTTALVRGGGLLRHSCSLSSICHTGICHVRTQQPRRQARCLASSTPAAHAGGWRQSLPFAPTIEFEGLQLEPSRVAELVGSTITEKRVARIEQVVASRTFDVVPVVEGLYDMGNLAAVCRSADALGFGAIHVITKGEKYKKSQRTSAGADKWLHVTAHDSTEAAVAHLKARGFQLVVTHLGPASVSLQDVDWTHPTAVVLGNEAAGVSPEMVAAADVCAIIPMSGFVESFNISVAGALVLYEARRRRQEILGRSGDLNPEEQEALRAHLMLRALKNSDAVLRNLLARPPPDWQEARFKAAVARRKQLQAKHAEKQALAAAAACSSSSSSSSSASADSSSSSSSSSSSIVSEDAGSESHSSGRDPVAAVAEAQPGPVYSSRL